jgi:hypothetical protein
MRGRAIRKALPLVVSLVLAGCQTWGPTWTEVTVAAKQGARHLERQ